MDNDVIDIDDLEETGEAEYFDDEDDLVDESDFVDSDDALFPTIEAPEELDDNEDEFDTEMRPSVRWDPEAGDFVRDGANRLVECDGLEAFATWCYKMVNTERYSHYEFHDELGVEMVEALEDGDHDLTESMVIRTVREALFVNPRTENVDGFVFDWDGDEMHFEFNVTVKEEDNVIKISV